MPIPPAAFASNLAFADVGGHYRAIRLDSALDRVKLRRIALAEPFAPVGVQAVCIMGKAMAPVAVEVDRQDGGVVSPMFPQRMILFDQPVLGLGFVTLTAGEQDHVVRAFHHVDAVDLHKADAVYECGQCGTRGGTGGCLCQSVTVQKQATSELIGKQRNGHGGRLAGALDGAKRQMGGATRGDWG